MGIWRAMPLLSTLAALVIIVHSAEEDFEPAYRDLRPRRLETVTPNYEQPWRIMDTEPVAIQTTPTDWDGSHQEEPPKRRRPVRKRKRRPQPTPDEDLIPQERHVYHEEYRPYQHEKFNQQAGVIRRRRKQFDSGQTERLNTWTDETVDANRPLVRKRGHKRKRPAVEDTWRELSEFNLYRPNENTEEINYETYIQPTEPIKYEDKLNYYSAGEIHLQNDDTVIKSGSDEREPPKSQEANFNDEHVQYTEADDNSDTKKDDKEDKSLSEFSLEINPIQTPTEDMIDTHEKLSEKSTNVFNEGERAESNEPLDPQTLKEVLKRSNGRSLSEILQQHNLSLVDLLHGKEKALSILKMDHSAQNDSSILVGQVNNNSTISNKSTEIKKENKRFRNRNVEPKPIESVRNTITMKTARDESMGSTLKPDMKEKVIEPTTSRPEYREIEKSNEPNQLTSETNPTTIEENVEITTTKSLIRRQFPVGVRRKLRMKPMNNTVYKSQLNRDLIALTSRRYQLSRNTSRSREWKDVMPTRVKLNVREESNKILANEVTTTSIPEETTVQDSLLDEKKTSTLTDATEVDDTSMTNIQSDSTSTEPIQTITTLDDDTTETENVPTTTPTPTTTICTTTPTTTEKPFEKPVSRSVVKASDLRRQAFNNRLKRKRLKQKTTTTEATQNYAMKDIFGMANLVSASEFIAKVQPRTTSSDEEDFTTLEDFMTTESSSKVQTKSKPTKIPKTKYSTTYATHPAILDTEETAKIEIEEILNDTRTSARLSKILMERNMTINELVEHRERGSSHIHLADIFHNASREPNPPEPFLSKSLIEPISRETYPLRALLDANLHDPTAKATTIEPNSTQLHYLNIPVVMDFGNNVNENGENMGIMSLFNNYTKIKKMDSDKNEFEEQTIETSSLPPKENKKKLTPTSRESRILKTDKDLVTWKEIIAIMHRGQNNNTNEVVETTTKDISPSQEIKKIMLDDDLDGDDGLIVLNNLHQGFDSYAASDEKIEVHAQERTEFPRAQSDARSNSAKSVTVATASIIGLAMVLFLLTYATFKWKQQRSMFRDKQSMRRDRIPTPVFENRKSHKNNSSTRSKSPMISSSNIYAIDTLDTRNGNDSPEYMWDTLRKPFQ
ncbi:uncharacterized protein [Epargyreus clarus]|uniref:uncharacterized protein n=1 Tax=Epargyreus clarus TaxID=520877 RepID=UPI003C2B3BB6